MMQLMAGARLSIALELTYSLVLVVRRFDELSPTMNGFSLVQPQVVEG